MTDGPLWEVSPDESLIMGRRASEPLVKGVATKIPTTVLGFAILILAAMPGCLSGGSPTEKTSEDAATAPGPETLVSSAISMRGRTPTYVCAQGTCPPYVDSGQNSYRVLPRVENATRIYANVTFAAVNPAVNTLVVYLLHGDGTAFKYAPGNYARGTSPVRIDFDLAAFPKDTRFALNVFQQTSGPAATIGTGQEFSLEGVLLSMEGDA